MGADFLANYSPMAGSSLSQREVRRDFSWLEISSISSTKSPQPPFPKGGKPTRTAFLKLKNDLDLDETVCRVTDSTSQKDKTNESTSRDRFRIGTASVVLSAGCVDSRQFDWRAGGAVLPSLFAISDTDGLVNHLGGHVAIALFS